MNFRLRIWRQKNGQSRGQLVDYEVRDLSPNTSFLEMLDILNENLLRASQQELAPRLPLGVSWLPALSVAKKVTVVAPSAEIVTEAVLPTTVVLATD